MAKLKEKLFSYTAFAKIFTHLFVVMEPKIAYHNFLMKKGDVKKADKFGFPAVKKWAKFATKAAGMRITVEGLEKIPKDRPLLFTPNHQSYADVPLLLHVLKDFDFGFLMRMQLNKFFAIEQISKIIKCVPINQENAREGIKALNKTAEQIKKGFSMLVFPEGKRGFSNTPDEFKNGAFKIVQKTGVTVVPIYIRNVFKVLEGNDFQITPTDIKVIILDPIETGDMKRDDVKQLHDKVYNLILNESKKYND
ncbi:MAG: 1-acyl-sn-glycerol-3-phosphate acyltransferase [Clostridia bacterium]|nr:1-acyl-sn-glycerol-3-phosphate acyltransferase [Clostridia bacterium]